MESVDETDVGEHSNDKNVEVEARELTDKELITLWSAQNAEDPDPDTQESTSGELDVVIVHGFFGTQKTPWESPGSGNCAWLADERPQCFKSVMSFGYDASVLLCGNDIQQRIRKLSIQLLENLLRARQELDKKRPILFIAFDIGGIIVKDALTLSILKPALYGEVSESSRTLLFYGCLHRHSYIDELEDKLSGFLYRSTPSDKPTLASSEHRIKALALVIADINYLFLESKQTFRCNVVSVFADPDSEHLDKALDNFTSTMGIPFELCFTGRSADSKSDDPIADVLDKQAGLVQGFEESVNGERALIAAAPPLLPLRTGSGPTHEFAWISENNCYQSWYNQRQPQLLYIFGQADTRSASEFIFYDLDKLYSDRTGQVVIYFTFDRYDIRRDNIQDMLAAIQAQLLGHFPSLADDVQDQISRYRSDRSLSHMDLLQWFEWYRNAGVIEGISCVLNHLDECEPVSRKAFLDHILYVSQTQEKPWRVLVTSREPGALMEEIGNWPSLDLVQSAPSSAQNSSLLSFENINRRYAHSRGPSEELENDLSKIRQLNTGVQEVILRRLVEIEQWPVQRSVTNIFGLIEGATMKSIVAKILDEISSHPYLVCALTWILFSIRPLSTWELANVLQPFNKTNQQDSATNPITATNIEKILCRQLAGLVVFRQKEVLIASPFIRKALETELGSTYGYSPEKAHATIAKFCLDYLSLPTTVENLKALHNVSKTTSLHGMWANNRTSLVDYATQFWLQHYTLSSPARNSPGFPDMNFQLFQESGAAAAWLQARWVLSDPLTRSKKSLETIYPAFAGVGLADEAESWCAGDSDVSSGLVEACFNGSTKSMRSLFPRVRHSTESLQEALVGAGASCDDVFWVELIQMINDSYPEFPWKSQASLVCRAAWLHLNGALAKLLEVGCPPNDMHPALRHEIRALRLAVRVNNIEGTKMIIEYDKESIDFVHDSNTTLVHLAAQYGHAEMIDFLVSDKGMDVDAKTAGGATPIYQACLYGNFKAVEKLVSLHADVNYKADSNQTNSSWGPLTCAIDERHRNCTRSLLDSPNIDLNTVAPGGTPLFYAIRSCFVDICEELLAKGIDPNNHPESRSLLIEAVLFMISSIDIIKMLLSKNARLEDTDSEGDTALTCTCWKAGPERLAMAKILLEHGANVNHTNERGNTLLHIAASRNDVEMVKLALQQEGVELNLVNQYSRTPLFYSIDNEEITRLLLEKGADPNLKFGNSESELLLCAIIRQDETVGEPVVRVLVEHGVEIDPSEEERDFRKWEPLELAVVRGQPNIVRILADAPGNTRTKKHLKIHADVNRTFASEWSLLHKAMNTDALAALMEYRPNVDVQNADGYVPLHCVINKTPLEQVKLLVRAGANLNITSNKGVTPLVQSLVVRNEEVANYLIDRGADIRSASRRYGGPLHIACSAGLVNVVTKLIRLGSNVNESLGGIASSPLVGIIRSNPKINSPETKSKIVDLLLEAKANTCPSPEADLGVLWNIGTAAAWAAHPELIDKLSSNGTNFTTKDRMGRSPVHIAALRGNMEIFDATSKAANMVAEKDEYGRNLVSWAAQSGSVEMLHRALQLTDDGAINEPDSHGWTPICWAARGVGSHYWASEGQRQMITELLERGADATVKCHVGDKTFTPKSIAIYHSCDAEVVDALRKSSGIEEEQEDSRVASTNSPTLFCDSCLFNCRGIYHHCDTCVNFDLCYKCYELVGKIHPQDHSFEIRSQEYSPENEGEEDGNGGDEKNDGNADEGQGDSSRDSSNDSETDSGSEQGD
ncbi:ankyrin repeat-containing domain protein [Xylariaceae sp. FL0255]|nr:ankyrin repeat-containing domain protein [Xylariaceae sp. FL0255]